MSLSSIRTWLQCDSDLPLTNRFWACFGPSKVSRHRKVRTDFAQRQSINQSSTKTSRACFINSLESLLPRNNQQKCWIFYTINGYTKQKQATTAFPASLKNKWSSISWKMVWNGGLVQHLQLPHLRYYRNTFFNTFLLDGCCLHQDSEYYYYCKVQKRIGTLTKDGARRSGN